jgi:phosphatidylglycerol:prolipoprotein diacylglycerol transferase
MQRTLFHLYGPLYIQSFGLMIALGLMLFTWLVLRHPRREHIISRDQFIDTLLLAVAVGTIGCRILYVITEWQTFSSWYDMLKMWEGGGSLLGGIISIITLMPLYMRYHHIPALALLDLAAIYAPLLQSVSRIGCFLAGCCYGTITQLPWAIVYTDLTSIAPLGVALHPAQLYSSFMLFCIFLLMYYKIQYMTTKPGQLLGIYLISAGIERFVMDFFRGDRTFFTLSELSLTFALHQWIALALIATGCALCVIVSLSQQSKCDTYESI